MSNTESTFTLDLFLKNHIEWGAKEVDRFVEFDNKTILTRVIEAVDGPGAKIGLNQINKYVSPLIPDELKVPIHAALDDVIAGETAEAAKHAFELLSTLVGRIEKLTPTTKDLLQSLVSIISAAVNSLIARKETQG